MSICLSYKNILNNSIPHIVIRYVHHGSIQDHRFLNIVFEDGLSSILNNKGFFPYQNNNTYICCTYDPNYKTTVKVKCDKCKLWEDNKKRKKYIIHHIPYFTDDRSIFFFLNTLASTYRPHRPIQG